jgi:hypothetical protein
MEVKPVVVPGVLVNPVKGHPGGLGHRVRGIEAEQKNTQNLRTDPT